jgi:YwiC-like protein
MARRSLWPREHGAYFQLAIPLVAALAARVPVAAAVALATAAWLAFLAHEPLLVVLGHRGARLRMAAGSRARVYVATLGGAAVATGALALALARPAALQVAALALVPAAMVIVLAWRRREHTLIGELIAAVALTEAAAPVAVASGAAPIAAIAAWFGWALGFGTSVIAVHRVMARHKRAATSIDRALAIGLAVVTVMCLALAARSATARIAAPLVAISVLLVIAPPSATRLRAVGVAIAVTAAASCALALALGVG